MIAFVPARGGSKRLADKNLREVGGRPLVEIACTTAHESGCFEQVVCSTDSGYIFLAVEESTDVLARPSDLATDDSRDIHWLAHALENYPCEEFCILRPTSPFRTVDTIRRAVKTWEKRRHEADSLRAVRPVSEVPGKMWYGQTDWLVPYQDSPYELHNVPSQHLSRGLFVQSGCIEIAWSRNVTELGSQSGERIVPFHTPMPEGLDINDEWDLMLARLIAELKEVVA